MTILPSRPRRTALVSVFLLATGCGGASSPGTPTPEPGGEAAPEAAALPEGHPTTVAPSLSRVATESRPEVGTVLETLGGGGYTYARLQVGEREIWVAGPTAPLEVGQEVGIAGAVSMGAFSSPSLERSFDELYFVGGFQAMGPPAGATRGEVLEVVFGGGYTYLLARVGEEEIWLAGPELEIQEGATVLWKGGMEMGEFYSTSLDRTFDNIVFVSRFWVEEG
ncbi:MAG: hypothetical protein JSU98_16575 [Gemmatimonadales bacterium]|nr:MAG: hypothetical protein JSU98_16575 [Gemmatimonadales bacterium]